MKKQFLKIASSLKTLKIQKFIEKYLKKSDFFYLNLSFLYKDTNFINKLKSHKNI